MVLRLVSHGVPWDTAWKLTPTKRLAFIVAFGENEGGTFNWRTMAWERKT